MKKIFSIAVAAVMALAVFTGCEYKVDYTNKDAVGADVSSIKFNKDNISLGRGYGNYEITDDGELHIKAAKSWADFTITPSEAINLKDATVKFKIKASSDISQTNQYCPLTILFYTNDTVYSETNIGISDLQAATDYTSFTIKTADLTTAGTNGSNGTANVKAESAAYFPYITKIGIEEQSCVGDIYISSITVNDTTKDSSELQAEIDDLEEEIKDLKEQVANGGSSTTETKTPVVTSVTEAELKVNSPYNNQATLTVLADSNPYKASVGDKIKVKFTATADSVPTTALKNLNAQLVDNSGKTVDSEGNKVWWITLCSQVSSKEISTTATDYEFEFTITTAAASADPTACLLVLNFGGGDTEPKYQDTAIKLTISDFSFVKE